MQPKLEDLCPLVQVFDMPRSLALYCGLLGFEVVQQVPTGDRCDWAWLTLGSAQLMLNTMYEASDRPQAPDPGRVAAHSDTCLFIGAPDVDALYSYLQSKGVGVNKPVVRDYGMKQLCVTDPDGYSICFQWPAARS